MIRNGNELNTIQYAEDWVNFEIASHVELMPDAGGPFVPDAFTDTTDGRGITWGISHITNAGRDWSRNHSILLRFDCCLSQDVDDPQMKQHHVRPDLEFLFRQGLSAKQRERIAQETEQK